MVELKNTSELREMLLETINSVRTGKTDPRSAQAIANLSSKILQSAKLDLDVLKFNVANQGLAKAGEKVLQLVNK